MPARCRFAGLLLAGLAAGIAGEAHASSVPAGPEVLAAGAVLPQGSRLGTLTLEQPRQILTMERLGQEQNDLVALGNTAFSAPDLSRHP